MNIRVAGLSHLNSDGTSRQDVLCLCKVEDEVIFVRDSINPYDYNAIKVCRPNGQQIGFVPKELAREMASKLDRGVEFSSTIKEITDKDDLGFRRVLISCSETR